VIHLRRLPDERGSLPLALLATIMVGALIASVTASMVTGQRHTRRDQNREQALQLAEVAFDRMAAQIISREQSTNFTIPATSQYSGNAVRTGTTWTITATGRAPDGRTRTVRGEVRQRSLFQMAAFGRVGVDYNGANGADSYRSGTWSGSGADRTFTPVGYDTYLRNPDNVLIPPNGDTGMGIVGTNGVLTLKGQAFSDADEARIYFAREADKIGEPPLPGATGFCNGVPATCAGWLPNNAGKLKYFRDELKLDPIILPGQPTQNFDGRNATLSGGTHVFTSAYLDSTTVFTGTPTNPTIIYLTGQLTIPNHARVNFTQHNGRWVPRPSPSLRIYSDSGGVAMNLGTHVQISAGIYAPRGAFGGGSQGHVYGALIANSIDNNGGTQFHFDEALLEADDVSPLLVSSWVEVQ
jgi:type II secretory pathway pseudopilin PulG